MSATPLQLGLDPLFVILAVVLLGLIFFFFLLVRRTLMGFKEGVEDARE